MDRRKRAVDQSGSARTNSKRSKQSTIPRPGVLDGGGKPPNGGSVLMNLLVSGCDVSAGYICLNARKPYARCYTSSPWSQHSSQISTPVVISLTFTDCASHCPTLCVRQTSTKVFSQFSYRVLNVFLVSCILSAGEMYLNYITVRIYRLDVFLLKTVIRIHSLCGDVSCDIVSVNH